MTTEANAARSAYTHPKEPKVDYPYGFQENFIPVHGPAVAKLIQDRVYGHSLQPERS